MIGAKASSMNACRQFWADDGQLFPNPVMEELPTSQELSSNWL
jgi:hypothetical protein